MKCRLLFVALFCCAGLLVFSSGSASAEPILVPCTPGGICSDALSFTFDGVNQTRFIVERPGESVTESIDFTFLSTGSDFDESNFTSDFVYLVEPGSETNCSSVTHLCDGHRSDAIQLHISHESGTGLTTVSVTLNSDEDPGTHDPVRGLVEIGAYQDITALLFGNLLVGSNHTGTVLVASDVEAPAAVPEPATMTLLATGLFMLGGMVRKRR